MHTPADKNSTLEDWLKGLNKEFRAQGLAVGQRPFIAWMRYSQDFNVQGLSLGSDIAEEIFRWFEANTKLEAHQIGSLFTGAFYYDTCFWPVDIHIAFGKVRLDALSSLQDMPESVKGELMSNPSDAWSCAVNWANTLDYAYGFDEMRKLQQAKSRFGLSLLENANRELKAAVSQLLESRRPNSKAAMSCRMATEIFLKAFLVLKASLSEKEIIAFSHHLHKSLAKVRELYPGHELLAIESKISVFPAIKDRYTGGELSSEMLWEMYCTALHVASFVTRSFTSRNALKQLLEENGIDSKPLKSP